MTDFTLERIRTAACVALLISLLAVCGASLAVAQDSPETSSDAPTAEQPADAKDAVNQVTFADLDALKKKVDSAADLSDEQKKQIADLIERARVELEQATKFANSIKERQQSTAEIEKERQRAQASLEATLKQPPIRIEDLDGLTLPELEQQLATKQQELVQAQNELSQREKYLTDRAARQKAIKDRLVAIPVELTDINDQLAKLTPGTDSPLLFNANRLKLLAERTRLENEPAALQAETAFLSAQEAAQIIQLSRSEWLAKVDHLKSYVKELQREVLKKKGKDAENRLDDARNGLKNAEALGIPQLSSIYEQNIDIVKQEIEYRQKLKAVTEAISNTKADIERISAKYTELEKRDQTIGNSKSFGILLRNEGRRLEQSHSPELYRQEIAQRTAEIQEAQANLFELAGELDRLEQPKARANLTAQQVLPMQLITEDSNDSQVNGDTPETQLTTKFATAYEQQQKFLSSLKNANEQYVNDLYELNNQQELLLSKVREFQKFINERILWVPTNNVLQIREVFTDTESLRLLTDPAAWAMMWTAFLRDARSRPVQYGLFLIAWSLLLLTQGRQREQIRLLGQKASSRLNTSMKPTWLAIWWTVLKSLTLPLPFLFLSLRGMHLHGSGSANINALAEPVFVISIWLLWLELVRNCCRERGLAEAHFQWPERVNKSLRVQLSSLIALATPVVLVAILIQSRSPDGEALPLQRVFGVTFLSLLAYTLHRLTSRKSGILIEWIERFPGGWMDRLSSVWHFVAVAVPLLLAGLSIAGYSYAVSRLCVRLAQTLMVVFAAVFFRSLLVRWLTLRQRRLAIEHARTVRAALAESKGQDENATAVKLEAQEVRTNLVEVSQQSKRLLNTTIVVVSLAGIWWIWVDVLPALEKLDAWTIPYTKLNPAKLLNATLIAIMATTAARNIPGLLEMVLLERLPLDRSIRYAIGAITRYIIVVIGLLIFGNSLGITWDSVQWLAAALTFGLGFGLQEIFANFVSGLIILFEQPVRVGDVVTIDSVTGTVSRIRIRSTTITDWDRKEYIVPNKEFITGRLLNWTLTDTTNRLVINVGVSYGANAKQVRELLYQIVKSQPLILENPAPMVTFEGFGDSSLNFVIRAFLPNLDNRMETIHALHTRIHEEFAKAGIEIPFPQRDLHIRTTVPVPVQQTNGAASPQPAPEEGHEPDLEESYDSSP